MQDPEIKSYFNPEKPFETFVNNTVQSFHKSYQGWLISYRKKQDMRNFIKIWILFLGLAFFALIFLIFINLASTRGYFLRLSTSQLNTSQAKSDIIRLEIIQKNKENWDNLVNPNIRSIKESVETIYVPTEA